LLGPGDPCPDLTVWRAPREAVSLHDLGGGGATLLLFYLFDWTGT
jgi:peroxiredoxin